MTNETENQQEETVQNANAGTLTITEDQLSQIINPQDTKCPSDSKGNVQQPDRTTRRNQAIAKIT